MPYIKQERRIKLFNLVENLSEDIQTDGEMNYVITALILLYVQEFTKNYSALNCMIGVLECAKLELYRRMVVPYEDKKKNENGDVY